MTLTFRSVCAAGRAFSIHLRHESFLLHHTHRCHPKLVLLVSHCFVTKRSVGGKEWFSRHISPLTVLTFINLIFFFIYLCIYFHLFLPVAMEKILYLFFQLDAVLSLSYVDFHKYNTISSSVYFCTFLSKWSLQLSTESSSFCHFLKLWSIIQAIIYLWHCSTSMYFFFLTS